jgi:hypothetical protein
MMKLHSTNLIAGFNLGVQYEDLDEDGQYLIIALGLFEIIFEW